MLPMAAVVGIGAISGGLLAGAAGLADRCCSASRVLASERSSPQPVHCTASTALIVAGLAVIGLCCFAMPAMTSVAMSASPG